METDRWLLFSPDPTQTTSELCGSIVTQPIEYAPSPSNTGVNVVPALVVFQTPPEATATNQTRGSRGSTARSAMRPDVSAGPMPRSSSPANTFSSYFFSFESLPSDFFESVAADLSSAGGRLFVAPCNGNDTTSRRRARRRANLVVIRRPL